MTEPKLTRRQMTRLVLAALGGLAAGCGKGAKPTADQPGDKDAPTGDAKAHSILSDPHICRGINTCKNKGKKETTNECAGQAHCATAAAHDCNGQNECRGQGGGERPGENECQGKGACEVPLTDKTWPKARMKFEEVMNAAGKKFGPAPAKKG